MRRAALVACVAVVGACGGKHSAPVSTIPAAQPLAERMLAILPAGPQIVVELDLARMRANATIGALAKELFAQAGGDVHGCAGAGSGSASAGSAAGDTGCGGARIPGLPAAITSSPLATADAVVLAAYGVGTAQAATITLVATKTDVPNGHRIAPDLVALGPDEWVGQLETRAAIAGDKSLAVPQELLTLRAHAMPKGASGAIVRITARLPFDARVALARMTGLDAAPSQLSLWGDVEDDFAIIIDADAVDPGEKAAKDSARRLAGTIRGALATLSDVPVIRATGITTSFSDARFVVQGTWVRTIIAVGPRHLARVVQRAREMLAAP